MPGDEPTIYRRPYYERWYLEEHGPYREGKLRREDMLTSILVSCLPRGDVEALREWTDLGSRFDLERLQDPRRLAEALAVPGVRPPRQVLDVGCGRGECLAAFNNLGVPVLSIDPSADAVAYARETLAAWTDHVGARPRVERADLGTLRRDWLEEPADVVLFLESIEHVDREVVRAWFAREVAERRSDLVSADCRIVIGNIWFPVWSPPDHLWGVGRAPASGDENRRIGRPYWWGEYDRLATLGGLDILFRSPTNPTVVFERRGTS